MMAGHQSTMRRTRKSTDAPTRMVLTKVDFRFCNPEPWILLQSSAVAGGSC